MGTWFSKQDTEVENSKAILQTADSPAIQINWAILSTGLSSVAIIIILLFILGICYKKNTRSNRRARRAEHHSIIHSINRGPAPGRRGYPEYPSSVANFPSSTFHHLLCC